MGLVELLQSETIDCQQIDAHLEALGHTERVAQTRALPGKLFKPLFDAVAGHRKLAVEDLVPANSARFAVVPFWGINNMPAFRRFQKPLYRTAEGQVGGRNVQTWQALTGPGYFTVTPGKQGEVIFDYVNLPTQAPQGWPRIKSNARGLSNFVFRGLIDIVRAVSEHVVIGEATRDGKPLGQYFILVREDVHRAQEPLERAAN